MRIVAGYASGRYCDVRIDRLKIGLLSNLKCADIRTERLGGHGFQADSFKFIGGAIVYINGPKADQFVIQSQSHILDQVGCVQQKLSRKQKRVFLPPVF